MRTIEVVLNSVMFAIVQTALTYLHTIKNLIVSSLTERLPVGITNHYTTSRKEISTMKTNPKLKTPEKALQTKSLTGLLEQSEDIKDLVEECVEELSSVNTTRKEIAGTHNQPTDVGDLLEKNEATEAKMGQAVDELSAVNQALEVEVDVHHLLKQRLNMVTQDEIAARHAAFHDPLTGLPNRELFVNRLEHGLAQAKRHGWNLAVMFVDINNFKDINDTHGHEIGDAVLKIIAQRLEQGTREVDTVSRYGGDEFLYLLMEFGDINDVKIIAEKITNVIAVPCQLSIGELIIKPSIGISICPKDGITVFDLIKRADEAMYVAKRTKSSYAFAQ
ncbi:GGDEF domain-containing protein [Methylotuvimicrobium alcaliphilum]|uniref:Diguanylate cyclase (Modular protein) n=2 Tax=Methylotuvimicrobium alcaliphilum TaxID=271065 RepID=G4SXA0_META2|nr:Diguanylate cyclase (modular protein) [Methylotuvimicrobium alcaliphilum 20Z]